MTFDAHANFAYSTIALAPNPPATGTTLIVASGQGALFPTPPFNATIWPAASSLNPLPVSTNAEIVRVTAVSGDTFTIERAQEGTAEQSIGAGDQIAASITAKTLTDVQTRLVGAPSVNGPLQLAGSNLALTQIFTSSGTYTVPPGASLLRVTLIGSGGGGAGGGSALTSGGVSQQCGGGGGGAGGVATHVIAVPSGTTSIPVSVAAGGSGSPGGAANGNGSNTATGGSYSTVSIAGVSYAGFGGGAGNGCPGNSSGTAWGGLPCCISESITSVGISSSNQGNFAIPGQGGLGTTNASFNGFSLPLSGICGGGAGGYATTVGGSGGQVGTYGQIGNYGNTAPSATTTGLNGESATLPGFGGAGGGGGAPGGAGGNGGNGAPGMVTIEVIG